MPDQFSQFEEVKGFKPSKFAGLEEITPPSTSPSMLAPGGFVDRNVLSGQLPFAGAMAGGMIGGVATTPLGAMGAPIGAGLGGAGGQALQNNIRRGLGLDGAPTTIGGEMSNVATSGLKSVRDEMLGQIAAKPIQDFLGHSAKLIASEKGGTLVEGKIPKMVRGSIESVPVVGGLIKATNEMNKEAAQQAFQSQEAARKAVYDQGTAELKDAFRVQEAARKAAFRSQRMASQEGIKMLPDATGAAIRVDAGTNLSKAIDLADHSLQQEVGKVVEPIISGHASAQISSEPTAQKILSVLNEQGLVDQSGNIARNRIGEIISPERKKMASRLIGIYDTLVSPPKPSPEFLSQFDPSGARIIPTSSGPTSSATTTIGKFNRTVKDLQSLANFGAANRTAEDKVFGSLSHAAKMNLYDGVQSVAGPESSQAIQSARKVFSENQGIFETLRKIADRPPEQIVDAARTAMPGTFIQETISRQPALKKPIADVVLNDVARNFTSPRSLQIVVDKYGRDTLKNLLDPSTFQALTNAEKNMAKAFQPYEQSLAPVPIPFVQGTPPSFKLSPFWQKRLNNVLSGQILAQPVMRDLFHAMGKFGLTDQVSKEASQAAMSYFQ